MEKAVINRVSGSEDISELLHLFKDRLGSLRRGDEFIEQMAEKLSKYGVVLKLDTDGDTAAFSAFYCNDFEKKQAFLSLIAVKEDHGGKGLGTEILDNTIAVCLEKGMETLRLEVNKNNSKAQSFYKKNGFVHTSEQTENTLFMQKNLRRGKNA